MGNENYRLVDIDKGWREIKSNIKNLKKVNLKIGLFGDGSPEENVAYRGAVHEYGSKKANIPSRPFMSQAFDDNIGRNKSVIKKLLKAYIPPKIGLRSFIRKITSLHEGQIKKSIVSGTFIPLKKGTVKKKGSSKPLIDTAVMLNSIRSKNR